MRREIPAVRIMPMSDKAPGFCGLDIDQVQARVFLRDLPAMKGRWRYPRVGLAAEPGTIVLFQYHARIVASAVFLRDEKFERPRNSSAGALHFDAASIRTFEPVDVPSMRAVWPAFRGFGHVRQFLNPTRYGTFKRRLKNVRGPAKH